MSDGFPCPIYRDPRVIDIDRSPGLGYGPAQTRDEVNRMDLIISRRSGDPPHGPGFPSRAFLGSRDVGTALCFSRQHHRLRQRNSQLAGLVGLLLFLRARSPGSGPGKAGNLAAPRSPGKQPALCGGQAPRPKVTSRSTWPLHPPQDVYLTPALPNVIFPFWEFPDIPDRDFGYDTRQNWARVCSEGRPHHHRLPLPPGTRFEKPGSTCPIGVVPVPLRPEHFEIPAWDPGPHLDPQLPACRLGRSQA